MKALKFPFQSTNHAAAVGIGGLHGLVFRMKSDKAVYRSAS